MAASATLPEPIDGLRADESRIRLAFVEHSSEYAALVRETLENATNGRFEVHPTDHLEAARSEVETGALDAVLVDFTAAAGGERGVVNIEEASHLATRVPVIVLTGSEQADDGPAPEVESTLLERIARSRLPDEILRAVRCHRRLGPRGSAEPVVLRDPLRACARVFARIGRTFSH